MLFKLLISIFISAALLTSTANAKPSSDPGLSYCKCICFSNSTVIPLYRPENPKKPCLSCTRQFCLDQKLVICKGAKVPELDTDVGTGTEGDVEARCFKRDSPRDQLVVTFFLLVVVSLMLYAALRARLRRAIETRGRPQDLREWGEALLPVQLQQYVAKLIPRRPDSWNDEMRASSRGYVPVSAGS
ncbi:uncharacterized protein L203_100767 [Cryptococcus depauperatus CBS 7841]|uniref:Uncharacterized protein n=1 Tax=Cryptococcus depauperatus CBS 7841 TaxID=1295531 RepID=A0A1E3IXC3_9TREE|nr:hypothetical protein L203_00554 [Cryptococcus depauperatus CBS 7841]